MKSKRKMWRMIRWRKWRSWWGEKEDEMAEKWTGGGDKGAEVVGE